MVGVLQSFSNYSVVVDLAINSKCKCFILVGEWLRSTVYSVLVDGGLQHAAIKPTNTDDT